MTPAERYRAKAAEFRASATKVLNARYAIELESLAHAYLRLAEQAEQNQRADVWAEFGPNVKLSGEEA